MSGYRKLHGVTPSSVSVSGSVQFSSVQSRLEVEIEVEVEVEVEVESRK